MTAPSLLSRGLRSPAELAERRPCGDRVRYLGGCRCAACRAANSAYETQRARARAAGESNGIVPADKARAHINALQAAGVGLRSISTAADVPYNIIGGISRGERPRLRAQSERKILAITTAAAADHALVPAGLTWKLLDELIAAGHTRKSLATALGQSGSGLQVGREQVTVVTAHRVALLHRRLIDPDARPVPAKATRRLIAALRDECFTPHQLERELGFPLASIGAPQTTAGIARKVLETYERLMA